MYNSNEFVRRTFYSLELKHQICKDHIENGLSLADCVKKYNLSCHSSVHDWLRKLGYIPGTNRRSRSAYIGVENIQIDSIGPNYFTGRMSGLMDAKFSGGIIMSNGRFDHDISAR